MHQLDREVRYYRSQKGKGKRKRTLPQQAEPKEETTQAPPQQGEANVQDENMYVNVKVNVDCKL